MRAASPADNKEKELGTCPATVATDFNGAHGGRQPAAHAGPLAGSLCGGKNPGHLCAKAEQLLALRVL